MIKCAKCKRITKPCESTGLFITQKIWEEGGRKHKDITQIERVCWSCSGIKILK
jgi:hypothetical protein